MLICFIRKTLKKENVEEPSNILLKSNALESKEEYIKIFTIEGGCKRTNITMVLKSILPDIDTHV